jgi:hypothetical protein
MDAGPRRDRRAAGAAPVVARQCVICGGPVGHPSPRVVTCSPECRAARKRETDRIAARTYRLRYPERRRATKRENYRRHRELKNARQRERRRAERLAQADAERPRALAALLAQHPLRALNQAVRRQQEATR